MKFYLWKTKLNNSKTTFTNFDSNKSNLSEKLF